MQKKLAAALLACSAASPAIAQFVKARDLVDLSLEQLASITVSSVSRRDEPLARAPASVYVITAEDIRRSGATSLPEALRLAPNLQVARADASQYAISARGFNNTLANKLLVLIDGRTVYTPLFSGTFWEAQDVMLEDIERIEVISGPGAVLWGANAVNGVINIISRSAADTQGTVATLGAGTRDKQLGLRFGAQAAGASYRVYAKAVRRDHTSMADGTPIRDMGEQVQFGFRADWSRTAGERFTLQGDGYGGEVQGQGREYEGLNLLGRWTRDLGEGAQLKQQAYYDLTARRHSGVFKEHLHTFDYELQHALKPMGRHRLQWGFGLRRHQDDIENSPLVVFTPPERSLYRNNVLVQDEIRLRNDLDLTLGAKVDWNSYTGSEFLPSARLGWQLAQAHFVWTALSRTVRAPSRVDRELTSPGAPPIVPPLLGGADFVSEVAKVFELGYRGQPRGSLSYSVTLFHHDYEHLRTTTLTPAGTFLTNEREGDVQGVEAWGSWRPADRWRLSAGMARLDQHLVTRPGSVAGAGEGNDPKGWYTLRAAFDLGASWDLDLMLRRYEELPNPPVPSYTALDARLGWYLSRGVELSLLLQNLTDRRHAEFGAAANRVEVERAAFFKVRVAL
jgi:iron complex outermembrane recepter protein